MIQIRKNTFETNSSSSHSLVIMTDNIIKENGEMDVNEPVSIGYTGSDEGLDKFEEKLKEEFGFHDPLHGIVGPVIGTHAGPGAKLIAYVKK